MSEMLQNKIPGSDKLNKIYLARCLNELKRFGAPLSGWYCEQMVDVKEENEEAPFSECDLCGCSSIRYEHHMRHAQFPFPLVVGCICAGLMEGDIFKAEERERQMKNRAKRRDNFIKKKWKANAQGAYTRRYRKQDICITQSEGQYTVMVGGVCIKQHKGKPITNLLTASHAAFIAIDPEVRQ